MVSFEKNMKLAEWIAKKIYISYKKCYELDDLIQESYLALIKASKKFDKNKKCKFSTYAYLYINGHIRNMIRDDRYRLGTREQRKNATHNILFSYNSISNEDSENKKVDFLSMFGEKDVNYQEIEFKIDLQNSVEDISDRDKKIMKLKLLGYTQKEIGISQVTTSRALRKVGKKLKEVM